MSSENISPDPLAQVLAERWDRRVNRKENTLVLLEVFSDNIVRKEAYKFNAILKQKDKDISSANSLIRALLCLLAWIFIASLYTLLTNDVWIGDVCLSCWGK